jgi:hypothetical protein
MGEVMSEHDGCTLCMGYGYECDCDCHTTDSTMSDIDKPIRVQVNTILEKMIAKPDNQPTAWIEMLDDMETLISTAVREAKIQSELEYATELTSYDSVLNDKYLMAQVMDRIDWCNKELAQLKEGVQE